MKRLIKPALLLLSLLLLVACSSQQSTPTAAVTKYLNAAKNFNILAIVQTIEPLESDEDEYDDLVDELQDGLDVEEMSDTERVLLDYLKENLEQLEFEFISEEIDEDTAVVTVDLSFIDGSNVLWNTLLNSHLEMFEKPDEIEDTLSDSLSVQVEESEVIKRDLVVEVHLVHKNGRWYITQDAINIPLFNASLAGLLVPFALMQGIEIEE